MNGYMWRGWSVASLALCRHTENDNLATKSSTVLQGLTVIYFHALFPITESDSASPSLTFHYWNDERRFRLGRPFLSSYQRH
eukprot:c36077_g1_i1 orf=237-482(-)